jgi:hypothetical protein
MTDETVGAGNRSSTHAAAGTPAESLGTPQPDAKQLRADIEETRQELGDTVQALAAKADVKTRAEEGAQRAMLTARTRTTELTERAKEYVADPANAAKVKGGGAAVAGTAVLAVLVQVRRRRNARPQTPWEKAVAYRDVALDSEALDQFTTIARQVLDSDAVHQVTEKAKEAAARPDSKPRAQGAATAVGAIILLTLLRRATRRSI